MMKFRLFFAVIVLTLTITRTTHSQNDPISQENKREIIDSLCQLIDIHYNNEDMAIQLSKMLSKNQKKGKYKDLIQYPEFARQIHLDMYQLCKDPHIALMYNPEVVAQSQESNDNEYLNNLLDDNHINYGFEQVKILPGNVGYLKLNRFPYPSDVEPVASGALAFLSNSDALIIDMRDNKGGYMEMVQFLMSYFFRYPTLINTMYQRSKDSTTQFYTYPYPHGEPMDSTDIYILTSWRTFSAGEWFTYTMQSNNKAMVIGEKTRGGASPTAMFYLKDKLIASIPNCLSIDPNTKTHFNAVGIQPDSVCNRQIALETAHQIALEKLSKETNIPELLDEYKWNIDGLSATTNPKTLSHSEMEILVGTYGERNFFIENGRLMYQREGRAKHEMIPINNHYFKFEQFDQFRLEFVIENGKAIAVKGVYGDGRSDYSVKKN